MLVDPERALAVVRDLGDAGVGVSLDDFGTGYSSLAPAQAARGRRAQDRPLVRGQRPATTTPTPRSCRRSPGSAGGSACASSPRASRTRRRSAQSPNGAPRYAQGYHISRPLPAEELTTFLWDCKLKPGPWTASVRRSRCPRSPSGRAAASAPAARRRITKAPRAAEGSSAERARPEPEKASNGFFALAAAMIPPSSAEPALDPSVHVAPEVVADAVDAGTGPDVVALVVACNDEAVAASGAEPVAARAAVEEVPCRPCP